MQDAGCRMQDARYRNIEKGMIVIPIINCKTTRFHKINTRPEIRKRRNNLDFLICPFL